MPKGALTEGREAANHLDASSPLLYKQRELLKVLNDERRLRHRDQKNTEVKQRVFVLGGL